MPRSETRGFEVALARFRASQASPTRLEEEIVLAVFDVKDVLSCADKRRVLKAFEKGDLKNEKLAAAAVNHYRDCTTCAILHVASPVSGAVSGGLNEQVAANLAGIIFNLYMMDDKRADALRILREWFAKNPTASLNKVILAIEESVGLADSLKELGALLTKTYDDGKCQEAGRQALMRVVDSFRPEDRKILSNG